MAETWLLSLENIYQNINTCLFFLANNSSSLSQQVCSTEQMRRSCADRERRLRRLRTWLEQQKKQLNHRTQPTSQTQAHKTLLELEVRCRRWTSAPSLSLSLASSELFPLSSQAVAGRASEAAAASRELKATRVHFGKKEDHPCDLSFSGQADTVCHAAGDLRKQVENKSKYLFGNRGHGKNKRARKSELKLFSKIPSEIS